MSPNGGDRSWIEISSVEFYKNIAAVIRKSVSGVSDCYSNNMYFLELNIF